MNNNATYLAPWGRSLKGMTIFASAVLIGSSAIVWMVIPPEATVTRVLLGMLPAAIMPAAALFVVRGYSLEDGKLVVHRLGWSHTIDLSLLNSVEFDPQAMKNSLKICGNSGLFVYCGSFWNKKLGKFRAFVTDTVRSVILRFTDTVVVVSPDRPEDFARQLARQKSVTLKAG